MIALRSRCWVCDSPVAETAEGLVGCPKCGPLTVPEGYERRFRPFTGEAELVRVTWCENCGADACDGCEGEA